MKITVKLENGYLMPYSKEDKLKLNEIKDGIYQTDIKNSDMRSLSQNKLIHQFCKNVSDVLNDSGLYVSDIIKYETRWTMEKVKYDIFHPVMCSIFKKNSTTKLKTNEVSEVIKVIIHALSNKGIDAKYIISE